MGTWIKVDDGLPENRKIIAAGHQAAWLYICGLAYCSRQLTNGRIPKSYVPRLADLPKPMAVAAKLVEVGLWHETEDCYVVHDYSLHQRTSDQVESDRVSARRRKSKQRSGSAGVTAMSHRDTWDIVTVTSRVCHSDVTTPETETETETEFSIQNHRATQDVVHRLDFDGESSQHRGVAA